MPRVGVDESLPTGRLHFPQGVQLSRFPERPCLFFAYRESASARHPSYPSFGLRDPAVSVAGYSTRESIPLHLERPAEHSLRTSSARHPLQRAQAGYPQAKRRSGWHFVAEKVRCAGRRGATVVDIWPRK